MDSLVNAVIKRIPSNEERGTCRARKDLKFGQIMSSEHAVSEFCLSYIALIELSSQPEYLTS